MGWALPAVLGRVSMGPSLVPRVNWVPRSQGRASVGPSPVPVVPVGTCLVTPGPWTLTCSPTQIPDLLFQLFHMRKTFKFVCLICLTRASLISRTYQCLTSPIQHHLGSCSQSHSPSPSRTMTEGPQQIPAHIAWLNLDMRSSSMHGIFRSYPTFDVTHQTCHCSEEPRRQTRSYPTFHVTHQTCHSPRARVYSSYTTFVTLTSTFHF